MLTQNTDQMTIMIETSRTLLWTEYARKGCGTLSQQATDPKAWDLLPDHFSNNPEAQALLKRVKEDKKLFEERSRVYYDDSVLKEVMKDSSRSSNGTNGH